MESFFAKGASESFGFGMNGHVAAESPIDSKFLLAVGERADEFFLGMFEFYVSIEMSCLSKFGGTKQTTERFIVIGFVLNCFMAMLLECFRNLNNIDRFHYLIVMESKTI